MWVVDSYSCNTFAYSLALNSQLLSVSSNQEANLNYVLWSGGL